MRFHLQLLLPAGYVVVGVGYGASVAQAHHHVIALAGPADGLHLVGGKASPAGEDWIVGFAVGKVDLKALVCLFTKPGGGNLQVKRPALQGGADVSAAGIGGAAAYGWRALLIQGMSNVREAVEANAYLDKQTFALTHSNDTYLYTNVSAVPKSKSSGGSSDDGSVSESSSDVDHGGGGGSY